MRIAGVVLAGGRATRMGGGDKALLEIDGESLMARCLARLAPQVAAMAINANGDPARYAAFGVPVLADSVPGFAGPLAGVLAGLDWAAEAGFEAVVSVAGDTPFFPADLAERLAEAAAPIAMAATEAPGRGLARHPTFGLWPVALREDLRASLEEGVRKVILWADRHGCGVAEFSTEPFDPFFNVNTPEDLERARALAGLLAEAEGA